MRSRLSITGATMASAAAEITSPNGDLVATVAVKDFGDVKDCPCYRVDFKGRAVVTESRLGLDLDGQVRSSLPLTTPWRVIMVAENSGRVLKVALPACGGEAIRIEPAPGRADLWDLWDR